ncbi:MAG TPA: Gfo/Idh/MocA family oxidoreductase [Nakamurella sp.]
MTIDVGIIGVGMIGQDHIRRLTQVVIGAAVVAITDVNTEQAQQIADGVPGAKVFVTGQELIAHESVDAIVVCSWGPTHEEYVLAAIAVGKPVFCEKPLATRRRRACGSSRPRPRSAVGSCRSATCAGTTPPTGR